MDNSDDFFWYKFFSLLIMRAALVFLLVVFALQSRSQQWEWIKKGSSTSESHLGMDMSVSPEGKVYTLHWWFKYISDDNYRLGISLQAYDSEGNFLWQDTMSTFSNENFLQSRIYYYHGKIYLITEYSHAMRIGNTIHNGNGNRNPVIIRYDENGNIDLVKNFRCNTYNSNCFLTVDTSENIYVTGTFKGILEAGDSTLSSQQLGTNLFLMKCNSSGDVLRLTKAVHIRNEYYSKMEAEGIQMDKQGNLVLAGKFNAGMVFKNYIDSLGSTSAYRHVIMRFNSADSITDTYNNYEWQAFFEEIHFSDNNKLNFIKKLQIPHGSQYSVVRLNPALQFSSLIYYPLFGSVKTRSKIDALTSDGQNFLFVAGKRLVYTSSNEAPDTFYMDIIRFSPADSLHQVISIKCNYQAEIVRMMVDDADDIYVQGYFYDTLTLAGQHLNSPSEKNAMFIAKMKNSAVALAENVKEEKFIVAPNPSDGIIKISCPDQQITEIIFRDVFGRVLFQSSHSGSSKEIDLSPYATGVYFIEFHGEGQSVVKKIIKQ